MAAPSNALEGHLVQLGPVSRREPGIYPAAVRQESSFAGDSQAQALLQSVLQRSQSRSEDAAIPTELVALVSAQLAKHPNLDRLVARAAASFEVDRGLNAIPLLTKIAGTLPAEQQFAFCLGLGESSSSFWRIQGRKLVQLLNTETAGLARLSAVNLHRLWLLAFEGRNLSTEEQQLLQRLLSSVAAGQDSALLSPVQSQLSPRHPVLSSAVSGLVLLDMAGELKSATSLAGYLEDLGYAATANEAAFRDVLKQLETVDERAVAEALGMMARTHSDLRADPHSFHASLAAALGGHIGRAAQPTGWKTDVFVDVLRAAYPHLRWEEVAASLDYEGFVVPDESANMLLLGAWQRAASAAFPIDVLCGRLWSNTLGQLSFLKCAVGVPPHLVRWDQAARKLAPVEGLQGGRSPTGTSNQAWLCLDLLDALARLAELGHQTAVRSILEVPLKQCPEVLLLGLGSVRADWSHLHLEVLNQLVATYVASHPNSSIVLPRLWRTCAAVVLNAMITLYEADSTTIRRTLEVCQEVNGLATALEAPSTPFVLELGMLAARSGGLDLQGWLQGCLSARGVSFCQACVEFLDPRVASAGQPDAAPVPGQPGRISLSVDALAVALRVLNSQLASGSLPSEMASQVNRLQQQALHVHPGMAANVARSARVADNTFPPDVEAEANSYYQQVYTEGATAEGLLQHLQRLQASPNPREQAVAKCMIFNLFDEYRFFNKYPDKELHITAVLFSGLVRLRLVQGQQLDTVLRLILDALRQPPGSKLFDFARETLRHGQDALLAWPHYCSHLLQVPHFREAEPQLAAKLELALREFSEGRAGALPPEPAVGGAPDGPALLGTDADSRAASGAAQAPAPVPAPAPAEAPAASPLEDTPPAVGNLAGQAGTTPRGQEVQMLPLATGPPAALNGPAAEPPVAVQPQETPVPPIQPPPSQMDPNRAFQAHNLETLEAALVQANIPYPPQQVQDKVAFLMNNLSTDNLSPKAEELGKLLTPEHWPWFVNYMVVRRAAQEVNHHKLYAALMDALAERELFKQLLATSYRYIRILLASEHIKTKSGERSLLRNLGWWLGRLTLARQQPVRQKDLDLKKIIYEAYEQGKMIAVLPFVVKTMEPCGADDNQVFTKTNPWIAAILALAAEIYHLDRLKLPLKFEIEMLFRLFTLNVSTYKPSDTLSCHVRNPVGNPDFLADRAPLPSASPAAAVDRASTPPPPPGPPPGQPSAAATLTPTPAPIPELPAPSPPQPPRQPATPQQMPSPIASQAPRAASPAAALATPAPRPTPPPSDAGPIAPAGQRLPDGAPEQPAVPAFAKLHQSVIISPSLSSISERLQLHKIVPMAVDHAIAEIIFPTVERSVTIGRMTTIELVTKDFALEADESRMRNGAHLMAGSLSGSLALVTGREPLRHSLASQLRLMLANALEPPALESTIATIVSDNLDLGCALIEKAATDKAIHEIDDHLMSGYQMRQRARANGQTFIDGAVAARFPASLPQPLRPKAGHLTPAQMRVYEDFARVPHPAGPTIAGPMPRAGDAQGDTASADEAQARQTQLNVRFQAWLARTEAIISKEAQVPSPSNRESSELAAAVAEIVSMAGDSEEGITALARKVFGRMFEVSGFRLHTQALATALHALALRLPDGRLAREVSSGWASLSRAVGDDRKWRFDAIESLLRNHLLLLPDLDGQVAEALASPQRPQAVMECAVKLVRMAAVAEQVVSASDLPATLDALSKQAASSSTGLLAHLIGLAHTKRPAKPAQSDSRYPPGLRDRVTDLLSEWVSLQEDHPAEKVHAAFVAKLDSEGFLKGGELTDQFLRLLMEASILYHNANDAAQQAPGRPSGTAQLSYLVADAFTRLMCILISAHRGGPALLAKVLGVWANFLQRDADEKGQEFNGRPFYRICMGCIQELTPSSRGDSDGIAYLATIAGALLEVQPLRVPGFTFPWLELVSHRNLMPKLLLAEGKRAWQPFQRLMMALLRFLEPYLRSAHLTDAVRLLYKGTLRVLLVLLHDLPEFLCEYHFELVGVVPTTCIQMRNLILSAFPRTMRLPDPFTPNLKVDLLPEIGMPPLFRPPADNLLPTSLKSELQSFINTRQPAAFPATLARRLALSPTDAMLADARYNVPLLNALVFFVGLSAIPRAKGVFTPKMQSPQMDIFSALINDMDAEGRHLFINAIANQLRYPNVHTHFFSCVLLYLFLEAPKEVVQEQITRVLLERLIVNRPHPWGLLVTFIELIKNPRYQFWSRSFTRCAAEIERLFDSVAHSCMSAGRPDDGISTSPPSNAPRARGASEASRA